MRGFGHTPATALQRLARVLRARIADYFDLPPPSQPDGGVGAALQAVEENLRVVLAARRRLQTERNAISNAPGGAAARAEHAIALGRDDLARAALRQRAALDERSAVIDRELKALGAEAARIEAMIEASGALRDRALRLRLEELDRLMADMNHDKKT